MVTELKPIERRVLELFDGKSSIFFPQIKMVNGTWCSITGEGNKEIAFDNMEAAQGFLSKMPKQAYAVHEYVEPEVKIEDLKPVGDA